MIDRGRSGNRRRNAERNEKSDEHMPRFHGATSMNDGNVGNVV